MSWSEAEVETILEQLRAGASVMTGGSRCHTSYYFRDGQWWCEDFDEGYTAERPYSEAGIREMIADHPERFRGVLKAPRWRRFSEAFLADDPRAVELLAHALEYGDVHDHGRILAAVLAGPASEPDPELVALIRSKLAGSTAYHVFMDAARWQRSPAVGRKGLEFVERLRELVGDAPGLASLRASFEELADPNPAA